MLNDKNESDTKLGGPADRKSNRAGKRICLSRASVCEPGNSASRPEVPDLLPLKSDSDCLCRVRGRQLPWAQRRAVRDAGGGRAGNCAESMWLPGERSHSHGHLNEGQPETRATGPKNPLGLRPGGGVD